MLKHRVLSFKYAIEGIASALKEEPNLKFHFFMAFIVILLGFYFSLSEFEWLIILFTIGLVIGIELTNTAIEEIVDSFTSDQHPGAKRAKDVAAGAVLVISIMATLIGFVIFLPHFLKLL